MKVPRWSDKQFQVETDANYDMTPFSLSSNRFTLLNVEQHKKGILKADASTSEIGN
jgi:hypothetical protein